MEVRLMRICARGFQQAEIFNSSSSPGSCRNILRVSRVFILSSDVKGEYNLLACGTFKWRVSRTLRRVFCVRGVHLHSGFHSGATREGRYICDYSLLEETHGLTGDEQCDVLCHASSDPADHCVSWNDFNDKSSTSLDIDNDRVASEAERTTRDKILVVNFYHFINIEDPHEEVARHAAFFQERDVRGRIYISHQGINAQLSGPARDSVAYPEWLKQDPRFADLFVQITASPRGHAFPRLKLRYRPSLVQVEGGTEQLLLADPSIRALPLSPREWKKRLDTAILLDTNGKSVSDQAMVALDASFNSNPDDIRQTVLLDVRNGYEWDIGHFKRAQRPNVDCFRSTEFGLREGECPSRDPLANIDKDTVDVMMYCTGGIRCDVYSAILRARGFKRLYTLKGGVSHYLKEIGTEQWAGNLFVFDSRLALSAASCQGKAQDSIPDCRILEETSTTQASEHDFARCRLCGDPLSEPCHRNCANLDCNELYLCCQECMVQQKGCCSNKCVSAPRIRPLLEKQYERWHNYRPVEPPVPKPVGYASLRAQKRRLRKEKNLMEGSRQMK